MVKKASITLADGRELIYFGDHADEEAGYPDLRPLPRIEVSSQVRHDPLLGEWVIVAGHRQDRTFLPPADHCPLDPSTPGRLTEIPAPSYQVVVLENRFPSLVPGGGEVEGGVVPAAGAAEEGVVPAAGAADGPDGLLATRPGNGRCEVVCFSEDHNASFADLTHDQAALVLAAWIDRSAALAALPGVEQVYCFENRGREIGVTLSHPHGQIYAYPFVTPRTARMLATSGAYQHDTGRNLFDDVLAAELASGSRVVLAGEHWVAFVPHAARWPYEVHVYPRRRMPDLQALGSPEMHEFCDVYLDLLRRFDRLFEAPAPYISGWHQAPVGAGLAEFALHLELFTIRRAPSKLKYLAGSESGMGAFTNDIAPEAAAAMLRGLGEGGSGMRAGGRG
jgi:UDPglucose--hexose-1-phosphate uridylyltransferase